MIDAIQGVDIFFIVMAIATVIATAIGALLGWYVLGIAREAKHLARTAREEGERIVADVSAVRHAVEERMVTQQIEKEDRVPEPKSEIRRRRGTKKIIVNG